MKAMILSAGLGTRLRPLTRSTPKALLLVANNPMIFYSLKLLKKYGLKEVVINLHHLGELIETELGDGHQLGMKIHYSWEREILGTGGGIKEAAKFFQGESLVVVNSDVLMDISLTNLIRFHQKKKGIATMVVRPRDPDSGFSSIQMGRGERILGIEEAAKQGETMYTGVQIIEPALLSYLPNHGQSCIIRNGYLPALKGGEKVYGFRYEGYWNDLGTLDRYRHADQDLTSGRIRLSFLE